VDDKKIIQRMTFATPEYIYWEKVEGREVHIKIEVAISENPFPGLWD
jgi:hypothetical protein